jgi:YbgC/YbaW family acyl-CoA thioester hydrolase
MSEPFRTSRRVEFVDTDMAGIAHFSNFFRWMEFAERDFLMARGLSFRGVFDGVEIGMPRVAAQCDYLKPVRFDDRLDIAVRLGNVGRKSLTYDFEFSVGGVAVARGRISCVCCRVLPDHRLEGIEIPASLRAALTAPGSSEPEA